MSVDIRTRPQIGQTRTPTFASVPHPQRVYIPPIPRGGHHPKLPQTIDDLWMNTYEERRAWLTIVMQTILVQSASFLWGTVWFTISVGTIVIARILPFTKRQAPQILIRGRKRLQMLHPADTPTSRPIKPSLLGIRAGSYIMSLDEPVTAIPSSDPATLIVDLNALHRPGAQSPHHDVPPAAAAPLSSVPEDDAGDLAPRYPSAECMPPSNSSPESSEEQLSTGSSSKTKKSKVLDRLPGVLRRRLRDADEDSSTVLEKKPKSRNTSPLRKLLPKSEPEVPADAYGRIPYRRNPDAVEKLETTFVNPLKINIKRKRNGSASTTPERPSTSLPSTSESSPSSSTDAQPFNSISSYLRQVVHPKASSGSRPSSPRRSYSSSSASSTSSNSVRTRRRSSSVSSTSTGASYPDVRRTQPYGPPYYAAMPSARPKSRRSSVARTSDDFRRPINEEAEPEEPRCSRSTAVEENAMGLTLHHREAHRR